MSQDVIEEGSRVLFGQTNGTESPSLGLAMLERAHSAARSLAGVLKGIAAEVEKAEQRSRSLEFENEALRNDNLVKARQIVTLEDQVTALEARLQGTMPPVSFSSGLSKDEELFYSLLSQTPRDWYVEGTHLQRDVVIEEGSRKRIVSISPSQAVAHLLFGRIEDVQAVDWRSAGFGTDDLFGREFDERRIWQACGAEVEKCAEAGGTQ